VAVIFSMQSRIFQFFHLHAFYAVSDSEAVAIFGGSGEVITYGSSLAFSCTAAIRPLKMLAANTTLVPEFPMPLLDFLPQW